MQKWIGVGIILAGVIGLALAISFSDVDSATYHGKTGLKAMTTVLDANFALLEASGISLGTGIVLTNGTDGGSCSVTFYVDQTDDAGDWSRLVAIDGTGVFYRSDVGAQGTLADMILLGVDGKISTLVGLDAIGAVDMDYGSADVTDHTFLTDSTGDAEIVLPNDSISGTEILDDTIDSADYAAGSIDAEHIAADNITSNLINGDAVHNEHILDNAIDSEHYTDGSIDAAHIAADNITSNLINGDAVHNEHILDNAINSEHYTDGSIDLAHMSSQSVDSDNIVQNTLDADDVDSAQMTGTTNGTVDVSTCSVAEYFGALHYDVITFTNVVETGTDGSDEGESQLIFTFPEGRIWIPTAAINAQCVVSSNCNGGATEDYYFVSIGSAACNDASGLTGTEANVIAQTSNDTASASALTTQWEADMTAGGDIVLDGTAAPAQLYFNMTVEDVVMQGNLTNTLTGSIGVLWAWLGDD